MLHFFRFTELSFPRVQLQGSGKALEQWIKYKSVLCKNSSGTFLQIPQPQLAFSRRAGPAEASGVLLTCSTTPEVEIYFLSVGDHPTCRFPAIREGLGDVRRAF